MTRWSVPLTQRVTPRSRDLISQLLLPRFSGTLLAAAAAAATAAAPAAAPAAAAPSFLRPLPLPPFPHHFLITHGSIHQMPHTKVVELFILFSFVPQSSLQDQEKGVGRPESWSAAGGGERSARNFGEV